MRLCSEHFRDPEDFNNSVNLLQQLLSHCRWKQKLKDDAIPSIFLYTPKKKSHTKRATGSPMVNSAGNINARHMCAILFSCALSFFFPIPANIVVKLNHLHFGPSIEGALFSVCEVDIKIERKVEINDVQEARREASTQTDAVARTEISWCTEREALQSRQQTPSLFSMLLLLPNF